MISSSRRCVLVGWMTVCAGCGGGSITDLRHGDIYHLVTSRPVAAFLHAPARAHTRP